MDYEQLSRLAWYEKKGKALTQNLKETEREVRKLMGRNELVYALGRGLSKLGSTSGIATGAIVGYCDSTGAHIDENARIALLAGPATATGLIGLFDGVKTFLVGNSIARSASAEISNGEAISQHQIDDMNTILDGGRRIRSSAVKDPLGGVLRGGFTTAAGYAMGYVAGLFTQ